MDKGGDLSNAIRQTILEHWIVQLSNCVYDRLDYDDRVKVLSICCYIRLCMYYCSSLVVRDDAYFSVIIALGC